MYPAMLDEMVVSDTVKPTDCELTSQNETSRPHVLERGRYAMQAAATVQRMLAVVAVSRRAAGVEGVLVSKGSCVCQHWFEGTYSWEYSG